MSIEPGIGNQNVELAKGGDRFSNHVQIGRLIRHIGLDKDRFAASLLDDADDARAINDIGDDDFRAFFREAFAISRADALRAAGYNRDSALKSSHQARSPSSME